jgi:hypothetical protein
MTMEAFRDSVCSRLADASFPNFDGENSRGAGCLVAAVVKRMN